MGPERQPFSQFAAWYVDDVLPLWVGAAYDKANGGFHESLDFTGEPVLGESRRVRVQSRQIHTFSQAALRGWSSKAAALATEGFSYLLATACPDEGARGCVHLISANGKILDDRRDLYDQAFLLLACASIWRLTQDRRALDLAGSTLAFLNSELKNPHGGWAESTLGETPRRQNPHMHLFEAFMALFVSTNRDMHRQYAKEILTLFEERFYDPNASTVREFFGTDLRETDPQKGAIIEPGHMMEWVWLLDKYDHLFGENHIQMMEKLYCAAIAAGRDDSGFLVDSIEAGIPFKNGARRLWPQTEYMKAAIALADRGIENALADAGALIDRLFQTYLNEKRRGLWCDQFDANGLKMAQAAPASILYHLHEAAAECADFTNKKGEQ